VNPHIRKNRPVKSGGPSVTAGRAGRLLP
jgi:hypothetical protein